MPPRDIAGQLLRQLMIESDRAQSNEHLHHAGRITQRERLGPDRGGTAVGWLLNGGGVRTRYPVTGCMVYPSNSHPPSSVVRHGHASYRASTNTDQDGHPPGEATCPRGQTRQICISWLPLSCSDPPPRNPAGMAMAVCLSSSRSRLVPTSISSGFDQHAKSLFMAAVRKSSMVGSLNATETS